MMIVSALIATGCKNAASLDAGSDAAKRCTGDPDCLTPEGVCDVSGTKTYVQYTTSEHMACVGETPACVDNQSMGIRDRKVQVAIWEQTRSNDEAER